MSEEYEYEADSGAGFGGLPNPFTFLSKQVFRVAIGVAVLVILLWLVSKIPIAGPPIAHTARLSIGGILRWVGLIA